MAGVTISSAVRTNLLSLQNISAGQSAVQNRLATGKKVNSALDNATSFFTASAFQSRAASLHSLQDSIATGVQTLQAANNGITAITSLVTQLRSTAQQALQSTTAYTAQAKVTSSSAITGATAADLRGTSSAVAATATSTNTVAAAALSSFARASNQATNSLSSLTDAQVARVSGTATALTSATSGTTTLSINDGSGATTYTYDTTATSSDATKFADLTDLNTKLTAAGKKVTADFGGAGSTLRFRGTDTSVATLTVTEGGTSNTLGLGAAGNRTAGSSLTIGSTTLTYDSSGAGGAGTFSSINDLNTKLGTANAGVTATAGAGGRLLLTSTTDAGTFTASGAAATALGLTAGTRSATAADTLTIADGATTAAFTFKSDSATGDNTTFKDIADLNTKLQALGSKARATDDGGKLKLTSTDTTSTITTTGTAATKLGGLATPAAPTATSTLSGKTMTFTVGTGTPLSVTFGDPAATPGSVKSLDDLNSKLSSVGLSAALDSSGSLSFTTTSATASKSFTIGGDATGVGTNFTTVASTSPTRGGAGADSRDSLVTQFNNLLTQIDTAAKDANFNGLNLLGGDTLSMIFNETNTSKLDVNGTSANSTGLGLSGVSATDFNDGGGINAVLSKIDTAKNSLATQASKFGSNLAVVQTRQDFTKNTINTLNVGADNLVNADMNEEATNLLSLNTSQSLAQQALSLANQSQQSVLQLLR